jgi:hypothetical protein
VVFAQPGVPSKSSMFGVDNPSAHTTMNIERVGHRRGHASMQRACSLAVTCIGIESGKHKM